jgi:hypothetical protein
MSMNEKLLAEIEPNARQVGGDHYKKNTVACPALKKAGVRKAYEGATVPGVGKIWVLNPDPALGLLGASCDQLKKVYQDERGTAAPAHKFASEGNKEKL